uniref:PDZ domain-containing protein n=1 Tax=Sinocyclocheilus rhinocerous TaxID=307959 RepID=A0A673HXH8_9TELE
RAKSEIIVKTVKEVCAEGLVVSGGKDGIFIKEVKPESPASKHLSVKEGDQILSATVYFDNLISVDTTLKTTDITVALGDDGKERREKSELRVSIPGKDKYEIETESQLKSSTSGMRTLDPSTFDNIL